MHTSSFRATKPSAVVPASGVHVGKLPSAVAATAGDLVARPVRAIQLTQGKVAIVDAEDFDALNAVKWCALQNGRTFYALRQVPNPDVGGPRQKHEYMHRLVLARKLGRAIAPGMMPDHDDGDGLNNTRSNLFEVTGRRNHENRHHPKTSQYIGVSRHADGGWEARIKVAGKNVYRSYHVSELEAALARERYIAAHPELGAGTNFPGGSL